MSKEVRVHQGAKREVVEGLQVLPQPGEGKLLIVVIRASSVRLQVVEDRSTIEEQQGEPGGGV